MNSGLRGTIFRVLRIAVLIFALIAGAQWLRQSLGSVRSEQGVINAEIVQIRTPITGALEMPALRPGMLRHKGEPLFTVRNVHFGERESVSVYNAVQNQVEVQQGELLGAKQSLESAAITRERARRLYRSQLIARIELEDEERRYEQAEKLVAAKEEQLVRSEQRARETQEQMQLAKESVVRMPVDGVIWSVSGKTGEQFDANKPVLEIINPEHVWVDAFFSERYAPELRPGLGGEVRTLDSASAWNGHLLSMRAGVGRFAFDTSVAVPPPELAKRQIAVRVESDSENPFGAVEFFGVGRSVEVTFHHRKAERTVGDALKEQWDSALGRMWRIARSDDAGNSLPR